MPPTKPDVTLHDGREVTFDLYKITIAEYRSLFDNKQTDSEGDALLARCSGMTVEEVTTLPQPDYRLLAKSFFAKAREPLADPN